jgi:hypothetical protein
MIRPVLYRPRPAVRINNNLLLWSSISHPSRDRVDSFSSTCAAGGIWVNSIEGPELALCDWQLFSAMQKNPQHLRFAPVLRAQRFAAIWNANTFPISCSGLTPAVSGSADRFRVAATLCARLWVARRLLPMNRTLPATICSST